MMSAINSAIGPAVQEAIVPSLMADQGLVLGPELLTNSDFDAGATSWVVNGANATHIATFAGGTLRYQSDTTSPQLNVLQENVAVVGKTYLLTVVVAAYVSGTVKIETRSPSIIVPTVPGTYTYRFTASATFVNVTRNSAGVDLALDKISLREVLSG